MVQGFKDKGSRIKVKGSGFKGSRFRFKDKG
jgi:hypothetical protein